MTKPLNITDSNGAKANISDLQLWGDPDTWKLLSKASSENGGWMKTTKAMPSVHGVLVQTETQQRMGDESTTFAVPKGMEAAALERFAADNLVITNVEERQAPDPTSPTGELIDVTVYTVFRKGNQWALSQSLVFVPGVEIAEEVLDGQVISRVLVPIVSGSPSLSALSADLLAR